MNNNTLGQERGEKRAYSSANWSQPAGAGVRAPTRQAVGLASTSKQPVD